MAAPLDFMWSKSNTATSGSDLRPHTILGHLYDSSEVAGQMWDRWLADSTRGRVNAVAGSVGGRDLLRLLAGLHDIGKISPAFQRKAPNLAAASGLPLCPDSDRARQWHHTLAGGAAITTLLQGTPWHDHRTWIANLVRGHHGVFPSGDKFGLRGDAVIRFYREVHGGESWESARRDAVNALVSQLGISPSIDTLPNISRPEPSDIVMMTGLVIMADWIASNGAVMPGIWAQHTHITTQISAARANAAWEQLQLHRGWGAALEAVEGRDVYTERFGHTNWPIRDTQAVTQLAAQELPAPGLMIVESPMGEGKTEAALIAIEVLAARFGFDGFFIGLPTQATSDAMFDRVADWLGRHWPTSPLALAHGKKVVNKTLQALPHWQSDGVGIDCDHPVMAPSEWFEGRKRTLLSPFVVGTIDNLLLAGARVRHLPLYHAALSGKVVVLDEVHACDVYMSRFLLAALSWLGAAGVPVVLLSATLPSRLRTELISAYTGQSESSDALEDLSYPRITTAIAGPTSETVVHSALSSRRALAITMRVLHEPHAAAAAARSGDDEIVALLEELLHDGGCALVIRNTVGRAQSTYAALRARLGGEDYDINLMHARFTAGHRAAHTSEALDKLGKSGRSGRPDRYILVATQVAEQSLDIDADVLITDLCPIDLLLQRIGRLHRHASNDPSRPERLRQPITYVTRLSDTPDLADSLPTIDPWHRFVYPLALLARTAQIMRRLDGAVVEIPADVPRLVAEVYEPTQHQTDIQQWQDTLQSYDRDFNQAQQISAIRGDNGTIARAWHCDDVTGLNDAASNDTEIIMVREGDISVEAVLLQRTGDNRYRTIGADTDVEFGAEDDITKDVLPAVMASTIRIPPSILTDAVLDLQPLPGWVNNPWLSNSHTLIINTEGQNTDLSITRNGRRIPLKIQYSPTLGLTWTSTNGTSAPDRTGITHS